MIPVLDDCILQIKWQRVVNSVTRLKYHVMAQKREEVNIEYNADKGRLGLVKSNYLCNDTQVLGSKEQAKYLTSSDSNHTVLFQRIATEQYHKNI